MSFEEAKQNLITEFDECHLHVLVLIKATHQDNSPETTAIRTKQVNKLGDRYCGAIPAEHLAQLICSWSSEKDLQLYAEMTKAENKLMILTLCMQCKHLKAVREYKKPVQTPQSILFNCN